jgi:hypothetical protein
LLSNKYFVNPEAGRRRIASIKENQQSRRFINRLFNKINKKENNCRAARESREHEKLYLYRSEVSVRDCRIINQALQFV